MKARFFRTPAEWRKWLGEHHAEANELWVGFYKRESGKPSITWQESVDEALCYGWIDGLRQRIDDVSYRIRFTPRRQRSIWSAVNIRRVNHLAAEGRMREAGLKAFEARREYRSGIYSYEQRSDTLPEPYARVLRKDKAAWEFFMSQPPSYRKMIGWWVVSAKKEETRLGRLQQLLVESAARRRIGQPRSTRS